MKRITVPPLRRREFISTLACVSFGAIKIPGTGLAQSDKAPGVDLADGLMTIFRDQRSARAVGREYLSRFPAEADKLYLISLIGQGYEGPTSLGGTPLREWVRSRIRDDFSARRVVDVRGWVLSEIEARICALTVLS